MEREQQHTWGREHRRDGSSEWRSTGFSTICGELRESRPPLRYRQHKKSSYVSIAIPFLLALAMGGVGLLYLAQYLSSSR